MKLPPGFPVKVDIPVLPTVSARVTFHDFAWKNTNQEGNRALEADGSNKEQAEAEVDSNKNGTVTKGSKKCADEKHNQDESNKGSSNTLAKKEKQHSEGKNEEDEDTTSRGSAEDSPNLDDSLFEIPVGYVEDNTRFPDL